MEKIKNILRPGHSEDDQTTYGTDNRPETAADYEKTDPTILKTDPDGAGSKSHNHGILRQILNPGGEKYDEQAYGTTAHAVDPTQPLPEREQGLLHTNEGVEEKNHGILRQILNPGGDKYDEQRYGSTAHADGPLNIATSGTVADVTNAPQIDSTDAATDKQSTGVLRQILNPGGEKYNQLQYGQTGTVVPGSEPNPNAPSDAFVPTAELVERSNSVADPTSSYGNTASSTAVNPASSYGNNAKSSSASGSTYVASSTTAATSYTQDAPSRTLFPADNDEMRSTGPSSTYDDEARQTALARDAAAAPGGFSEAGVLARNNQSDVADATFTERSQPIG